MGCVLAELLGGRPIFKGKDYIDQLNIVLNYVGTPSDRTLRRVGSPRVRPLVLPPEQPLTPESQAQDYIRSLPYKSGISFHTLFPTANPQALDLLSRLLAFDPTERITCEAALEHPYLAVWHEPADEPVCENKFDFGFEREESAEGMRKLIVEEVENFRRMVRPSSSGLGLLADAAKVRPPARQNSGPKRQETMPLPVPSRDEIMASPGGSQPEEREPYAGSPEEEVPGDELERELGGYGVAR